MISDPQFWVFIAFIIFIGIIFKPVRKTLISNLDNKISEIRENINQAEKIKNDSQQTLSEIKKRQNEVMQEILIISQKTKEKISKIEESTNQKLDVQIKKINELTKAQDVFITTEVGQHQMWAAQHYKFDKPNRWMTSGGLGTMGYGLPAAVGVQVANPEKLVIDIAGEASVLMTMQEMSTAVQYKLPIKIFILNNEYMGMVRQWQELLHEKNYSESYTAALPDFVKLAEAYGCVGIRANKPEELDGKIEEMLSVNRPVIFDCVVDKTENCYPMIPSGKPHNQMLLGKQDEKEDKISEEGKVLV